MRGNTETRGARKARQRRIERQRRIWFSTGDPYAGGGRTAVMACEAPVGSLNLVMPESLEKVDTRLYGPSVSERRSGLIRALRSLAGLFLGRKGKM